MKKGQKLHRPAYKTMWQAAERELHGVRALLATAEDKYEWAEGHRKALGADLIDTNTSRNRWATAAVIATLALVVIGIILLAR